jgi:uncharacterized protein
VITCLATPFSDFLFGDGRRKMFKLIFLAAPIVLIGAITPASAQIARIVSDKRTIEISASEKVSVPAEIAIVKVGYQNQAGTKDDAFTENKKTSTKIIQALLDAKVPKESIETQSLSLERNEEVSGTVRSKPPVFTADQEWRIHVKASDAQKVVDIMVGAGANVVNNVDWMVADPHALEAKAYAAALARAKSIAESTASQAAVKLGEILSISNSSGNLSLFAKLGTATQTIEVSAERTPSIPLTLFAPLIEREASVNVVYAIDK